MDNDNIKLNKGIEIYFSISAISIITLSIIIEATSAFYIIHNINCINGINIMYVYLMAILLLLLVLTGLITKIYYILKSNAYLRENKQNVGSEGSEDRGHGGSGSSIKVPVKTNFSFPDRKKGSGLNNQH
jgi:hypothetical protein